MHCEEEHYEAQLVRIRCGDLNPEGPGVKEDEIDAPINKRYPGRIQIIHSGCYAIIPLSNDQHQALSTEIKNAFCFEVYVYPTMSKKKEQFIIDLFDIKREEGFYLKLTDKGILQAKIGFSKNTALKLTSTLPLMNHVWYRVVFAYSQDQYWLIQKSLDSYHHYTDRTVSVASTQLIKLANSPIIIGGKLASADQKMRIIAKNTWNGKIDNLAFFNLKNQSLATLPDIFDYPFVQ